MNEMVNRTVLTEYGQFRLEQISGPKVRYKDDEPNTLIFTVPDVDKTETIKFRLHSPYNTYVEHEIDVIPKGKNMKSCEIIDKKEIVLDGYEVEIQKCYLPFKGH